MTKRKSKSAKTTVKAAAAKQSVTKSSPVPATAATPPLIVLGFDEQQKPRGARFVDAKPDLVTKAADLLGFKVYEASSEDVAEYAKKLPLGRLYANGRGFVPNVRQDLYSDLVVALGLEPQAALSPETDKDSLPAARGLPQSSEAHQRAEALQRLANGEMQADIARTYAVDTTTIGRLEAAAAGK